MAAGKLNEAADLYEEAVLENPDDWLALQAYLDCLLPGSAAQGKPAAGVDVAAGLEPLTIDLGKLELKNGTAHAISPQARVRHSQELYENTLSELYPIPPRHTLTANLH